MDSKLVGVGVAFFDSLLGGEQAWIPNFYLKSFVMDSVQVGKAVFVQENNAIPGIEPRTVHPDDWLSQGHGKKHPE